MRTALTQALETAVRDRTLVKLVLSAPSPGGVSDRQKAPSRYTIRLIELRDKLVLQWSVRIGKQEVHENLPLGPSCSRLNEIFPAVCREANLLTSQADIHYRSRDGRSVKILEKAADRLPPPVGHDREKKYLIPEGVPCPFLEAIGVMTADGRVRSRMTHKFHQINRFLELVNDVTPHLPETGQLRVVDFGSGKSYLTFALHHLLVNVHQREVHILAVDQNADVIATCRGLCRQLHLSGIEFAAQPILKVEQTGPVHLAVALHACDGATDQALAQAVRWQSEVILAVPCCQHEVARSMSSVPLEPVLQHGILKERIAALATDALRAEALQAVGYQTQVLEFIDLDHTPKNLMIRATRRRNAVANEKSRAAYTAMKTFLGLGAIQTDAIFTERGSSDAGHSLLPISE